MRLVCVTPFYEPAWHLGGIVRSVSQLCRGLAAMGIDVTVYTTDSGRDRRLDVPVNREIERDGVSVTYFHADTLRWPYSRHLGAACAATMARFDLLYVVSLWNYPGIPARSAAIRHRVPYVESFRGSLAPATLRRQRLLKWIYLTTLVRPALRRAAAIHYTAPVERTWTSALRLTPPSFIVPNGLDLHEFDTLPARADARRAFGVSGDHFVVTSLSRLDARKGLDLLVDAFLALVRTEPKSRLLIAGPDDGFGPVLHDLVLRRGLSDHVQFLGYLHPSRRRELFAAADVFALVAREGENFGNAAVEAMAAGVPVLLSDQVGVAAEAASSGAARVVSLAPALIAAALRDLHDEPDVRRALGERARCMVRERYAIDAVARQMALAFEDAISGRRTRGLRWSDSDA